MKPGKRGGKHIRERRCGEGAYGSTKYHICSFSLHFGNFRLSLCQFIFYFQRSELSTYQRIARPMRDLRPRIPMFVKC